MHRLFVILLVLPMLSPASIGAAAKGADDGPAIRWNHPWVPRRYFDYRHERWRHIKEADLGVLIEDATERYTYGAKGSVEHHQSYTMRVRDPDWLPEFWHLVTRSPLRETRILEFDVTWEYAGRTRVFGEADLIEYTQAPGATYISDDVGLWLPLDRSKPGVLRVSVTTRDGPHVGFEEYIGNQELLQLGPYVKSRTLIIEAPQSQPLRFETRFFTLQELPAPEAVGASYRYTFTFETLYRFLGEHSMPDARDSFPSLAWSNQPSWEHTAALVYAQWEPELASTDAMDRWAAELVEDLETVADQALAIHDAVATDWDYLGFYPSASGWIPHAAAHCYSTRIGDCKDKTALMISLMRSVGLDAWPAIVSAGTPHQLTEVPTLGGFNHAIVAVSDPSQEGGVFFLDSVDAGIGSRPVGEWLQDRDALMLKPEGGGLVHIPPTPPERWLEEDETIITLDADGIAEATLVWRWVGSRANEEVARRSSTDPEKWARILRRAILKSWPGAEILALEEGPDPESPRDAWLLTATLRSEHLASRAGPHLVITPPWVHGRDPARLPVDAGRRVHPVVLDPLFQRSTIRVRIPAGATVVALPQVLDKQRDDWSATLASSADVAGEVEVILEVREEPGRMEPGLEEARRNFARAVEAAQQRPIILRMEN